MTPRARTIICISLALVVVNIGYVFVQPTSPVMIEKGNVIVDARGHGLLYVSGTLTAPANQSVNVIDGRSIRFPSESVADVGIYQLVPLARCPKPGVCNVCGPIQQCINPVPPPPPFPVSGSTTLQGFLRTATP